MKAGEHHEHAAKQHEAGHPEAAAHYAHLAHGHDQYATHHAGEAAKAHIADDDKAKAAKA